jgi:cell division protein FtsL
MGIKSNTGGKIAFKYSNDDLNRIENHDTDSTKEFKTALNNWRENKKNSILNISKLHKLTYFIFIVIIILFIILIKYKQSSP